MLRARIPPFIIFSFHHCSKGQVPYVNCWVKGLHTASKHLWRLCDIRDILNLQVGLSNHLCRSSGGKKPDLRLFLFLHRNFIILPDVGLEESIGEVEEAF